MNAHFYIHICVSVSVSVSVCVCVRTCVSGHLYDDISILLESVLTPSIIWFRIMRIEPKGVEKSGRIQYGVLKEGSRIKEKVSWFGFETF